MFKGRHTFGRSVSLLAACFCLFTLAQVARPLAFTTLRCRPQIAAKHPKFTRYALEEVSGQGPTVSAHSALESSDFLPRITQQGPRTQQMYAWDWPLRHLSVHRRIPPPTPDDAH